MQHSWPRTAHNNTELSWVRQRTDRVELPVLEEVTWSTREPKSSALHRQPRQLFGWLNRQRIQLTEVSSTVLVGKKAKMPITVPAVPSVGRETGSLVIAVIGLSLRDVESLKLLDVNC